LVDIELDAHPGPPGDSPRYKGPADGDLVRELASLFQALRASQAKKRLALIAAAIVLVIIGNTVGQLRLNDWQGAFYDALQQHDLGAFVWQSFVFLGIVAVLLALVVSQTWLTEVMKIALRNWLTRDVLGAWLAPKRAYLLGFEGDISENPDQRIQEDVRHLSELAADLSVGLLQASLLLVAFIGVLWVLSSEVAFVWQGERFAIPGYMVWCALAYALFGAYLTWRVGRPLIALNSEHYSREAELRFALVRISESADSVALNGGESGEQRLADRLVQNVVDIMYRLANGLARLTWVTSGYGWISLIVPVIVAAPGYFAGTLTLGTLMMVVNAFTQVQQALRWYVDNYPRIADWSATMQRVCALRQALAGLDSLERHAERIDVVEKPDGSLTLDGVQVALAGLGDGHAVLEEPKVEIKPGERVVIVGPAGSGKTTLFLAIAGLWPWGSGRIVLPPRADIVFMPQRPYLPLGTLRAALAYPHEAEHLTDAQAVAALDALDLLRLAPSLDRAERWDKTLSLDEQQSLAFARLVLQAPKWVFIDEAMSALDEESSDLVRALFNGPLAGCTVIATARRPAPDQFFTRTLTLKRIAPIARAAEIILRPK
jgi:vitamin B12/bleomycin/antimicrobial peptide transport system ATP-binding/permease protein